jgi:hypothetical protein
MIPALADAVLQITENKIIGAKAQHLFSHVFGTTEVVPCYKAFTASIL